MKDVIYNCWRILKMIFAAISLCIAIISVLAWYDTQRFEMLLFCFIGLAFMISLITSKL